MEWSGLVDFRLVNAGGAKNWADKSGEYGGKGLSRYGAGAGEERHTNFHLGMIGIVADLIVEDEPIAHIQLNYSDHRTGAGNDWGELGIAEAYITERNSWLEIRFGFLIPEISLEHPNTAWSTRYTITPSAINSWVGEEIRSLGLELNVEMAEWSKFTLGTFSHNDAIATVLTYRGWALHDYQGTYGTRLRWNQVPDEINPSNSWVEPFKEIDDKLGLYAKLKLTTPDQANQISAFTITILQTPQIRWCELRLAN